MLLRGDGMGLSSRALAVPSPDQQPGTAELMKIADA